MVSKPLLVGLAIGTVWNLCDGTPLFATVATLILGLIVGRVLYIMEIMR